MWTIIIIIFICVAIFNFIAYKGKMDSFDEYFLMTILGFITGLLLGILVAAALIPAKTETEITEYNIEALKDNRNSEGEFFLGCGKIDGVMKFAFYYEENGLFKYKELNCDKASIKYSNDEPKFQIIKTVMKKNEVINKFSVISNDETYILQIPKGSIKTDISIDLQ